MSEELKPFEIGDSVIFQSLHDELVLLKLTNQEYYGLDSVGADVWKLLLKHSNVADAARELQTMYAVDEPTAVRDIEKLVAELVDAGLLKKADRAA